MRLPFEIANLKRKHKLIKSYQIARERKHPVESWITLGKGHALNKQKAVVVEEERRKQYRSSGIKRVEVPNIPMFRHGGYAWMAASLILQGNPYLSGEDATAYMQLVGV